MKLHVLSSGSSGNSYCIETDTDLLFVDIGVTFTTVRKQLNPLLSGKAVSLFITHEHTDHISGIMPFIRALHPKIYTGAGTARQLAGNGVPQDYLYPLAADGYYDMGNFAVTPFNVSHDAAEPFGYKLMTPCGNVGFLTDLGCVTQGELAHLEGVDVLVLEANHDEELLKKGRYPAYLKKRIASHKGHLSNVDAVSVLAALYGGSLNRCLFAHVSEENNDYDLLDKLGTFCGKQYRVKIDVLRQKSYSCHDISPLSRAII